MPKMTGGLSGRVLGIVFYHRNINNIKLDPKPAAVATPRAIILVLVDKKPKIHMVPPYSKKSKFSVKFQKTGRKLMKNPRMGPKAHTNPLYINI